MTTNDFEVFVDKLVKASANIKIEPEKTNNEEINNEEINNEEINNEEINNEETNNEEILNDMDDPIGLGFARRCLVRRFPSRGCHCLYT